MNEEALLYSFELFSKDGYEGNIEDYKELIKTNKEALSHSYYLFSMDGYEGDEDKFKDLVGAKPAKTEAVATETAPVIAEEEAVDGGLVSEDGSSELSSDESKKDITKSKVDDDDKKSYLSKLWIDINKGSSSLGEMMASVPETIYDVFAIPQNLVAKITGNESISASSKKFKKITGISNPILDFYEKESEKLSKVQDIYNNENYEYQGIYKNFENGNYLDGFKQLGSGIAESAPVSISMMVGGATTSAAKLAGASTVAMAGPEIKDQLENEAQSSLTSIVKGIGLAGAESVFSSIGTGTLGKVYKDILLKEGKEEGVKIFRNGLVEMYATALKKAGAPAAMLGEGVEEVATTITQNMINGVGAFDNVADSFIQGVGGGSLYGAPINVSKAKKAVQEGIVNVKVNRIIKDSEFTNSIEPFAFSDASDLQLNILKNKGAFELINNKVDKEVLGGRISKEEGDKIKTNVLRTQGSINTIDRTDINESDKVTAVNLLKEKREKENKIKSINDSSLTESESERIKTINEELSSLVKKGSLSVSSSELGNNIETVEKLASKIKGVSVKPLDNAEAIDSFIKENDLDIDKKASEQQGFIFQNKETGEQTIVINKEVASKERAVNVAAHEFLHALLFQTVKDSSTTQVSLGNSLKSYLNKVDADQVKDSDFAKRLDQYNQDPNNVKAEEVITLFSDALATGDIKFDENVFTRIGDVIRRALQSVGVSIKFNSGKDVYNFVKDYNKSISKGKLTRAQVKAAEGVKGSLVAEGVKDTSSAELKLSKADEDLKIKESIKKKGKEISALVPEGTTKKQYDRRIVGDVYQKLIATDYLDKTIKNQFRKNNIIVEDGKVYDVDIDTVIEDIKQRLLEGTILRFNPEANKDFGGFLMSELVNYRIGDVTNKLKLKKGTKRIDAEAGTIGSISEIADDSMSIEDQIDLNNAKEESYTELTKATEILSKEQYDRVFKEVEAAVPNIKKEDLSYKQVKEFGAEIVSEITGVPVEKILNTNKNMSKGQTTSGANFIEENINYIRKTLPKGAVQEAANEDLMGTATNLPNKVLNKLYNKDPRITKKSGLSPYTLKPGLKNQDILDAIGRFKRDDDRKIQINPRSPEAVAIQGLLSIVERNISNELVRTVESDLTPNQKQDVAAGKSDTMFSKSFSLGLEAGSNTDNINSVLFSKSARDKYEQVLRAKRPELKDIPEQVDNLINWADGLDVKENKKAKYKKLGLFYMANGYVIFPEDGYKVAEAIRLATINKVDPYAFNNPNELIEKYEKVTKIAKVNPDTVSEFSNKEEISGYTIYDVQDSKKGQEAVRRIVDSNWGEKSNPWCLVARTNDTYLGHEEAYSEKEVEDIIATNEALGNTVERAGHYMSNGKKVYELVVYAPKNGGELARSFGLWKGYNEEGNGFKIAFKNGKLNSFRDGNDMLWWDRMDKPKKGPDMKAKPDANGLIADGYFDLESGNNVVEGYSKDYKKGNLTIEEEYNKDKELTNRNTFEATENSNKSLIESYSMDRLERDDYIETESKYKNATDRTIKTTRKLGDVFEKETRTLYFDKNDNFIEDRKYKNIKNGVVTEEINITDNVTANTLTIYKAETINGKKNVLIDERKNPKYNINANSLFSKNINANLYKNNKNYVNFRTSIKNREMFHGGSKTTSSEATWFYLDDAEAAEMWGDGKVYKAKASSLDDYLVIPDLNDVSEYHKHASKKFKLPEENFFDVRDIIKLPNAEEIISDWIDWTTKNETDWDLGYNLYEDGNITNGAAVTVIGKIPESSLELAQDSVNKDESISNVIFNDEVALENNINPKTLTSVKFSLNTRQTEIKSKRINKIAEKAWIESQGDQELFYYLVNKYLRKTTLKDKKLQRNIRRIPNATSTKGNITEYFQWHKLNDNIPLKEYLGIKRLIPKKWNSKNDIEAEFEDGSIEGIEVKMSWEDIMGSTSMYYDIGKKFMSVKHSDGVDKLSSVIMDSINKNQEIIKLANEGLENAAKLNDVRRNKSQEVSYPFVIESENDSSARVNRKNLNRPTFETIEISVDQVIEHYTKKNVGLIIIGNEMFYIQDKRGKFKNAPVPIKKLDTKAALRIRIKPSGIRYSPRFKKYIDTYSLVAQFQFSEKPKGGVLFSKAAGTVLDKQFNDIIENKTGIESYKNYKKVKAQVVGASKGKFNFFIAPSAEDFVGLLYKTLGKGKIGDAQMAWYKENLLDPYARAMQKVSRDRNFMARNFLAIKKELKIVPKNLKKKIPGEPFTQEQAIRVYIWNKKGSTIPEISENDSIYLTNFVENNEKLKTFADQVIALSGIEDYAKPGDSWVTGTITTDMLEALNTTKRAKYLELWQQNADEIFSEKNLNKLEAAFGADYKEAMKNILKRMKTGRNRAFGGDSLTGRFVDWMTGATGAIMFFNTRSAVLQTLSAINFINFGDNNVFAASKAFANQKQYWSDFKMLFNSDFLVERRDGLKINVNEADIADIAKEKGVRGLINKLLKLGFTPTQLADSFAIATGGATFYRNRLKSLIKDGMDPVAAEKQAMRDFRETAEESQQSSRPDKISAQQAGPLGRTILAFSNTPAQYARIIKKAASDIKNGRGDLKTNVSKIMYYALAQNLLFNALQKALFAAVFDEDEEEIDDKTINIVNGMADSILVGTGVVGAIVSVLKNAGVRWVKEEQKSNPKYDNAAFELLKISPPLSSKINKLRAASRSYDWDRNKMKESGLSIDNPANLAIGNVVSAVTNVPLDRVVKKVQNIKAASDSEIETYKKIFLLAGWSKWDLGIKDTKKKKKKSRRKKRKTISD